MPYDFSDVDPDAYPALYAAISGPATDAWLMRKEQTYPGGNEVWSVMNFETATYVGYYPHAATRYLCLVHPGEVTCVHIEAVKAAQAK